MDELIRRLVMRGYTVTFQPTGERLTSDKVHCSIQIATHVFARGLAETTEQAFNDALLEIIDRDRDNLT